MLIPRSKVLANHPPFLRCPSLGEYCSDWIRSFSPILAEDKMSSKSKGNLSTEQVNEAIALLLDNSSVVDGKRKLARGARKKVQAKFKLSECQVS